MFACWLLSCYGLRRSEVLGIRWSALEGDTLSIRRSRVAVGKESIEGCRSRASKTKLKPSAVPWSDDSLSIYSDAQREDLRAAGAALFG